MSPEIENIYCDTPPPLHSRTCGDDVMMRAEVVYMDDDFDEGPDFKDQTHSVCRAEAQAIATPTATVSALTDGEFYDVSAIPSTPSQAPEAAPVATIIPIFQEEDRHTNNNTRTAEEQQSPNTGNQISDQNIQNINNRKNETIIIEASSAPAPYDKMLKRYCVSHGTGSSTEDGFETHHDLSNSIHEKRMLFQQNVSIWEFRYDEPTKNTTTCRCTIM